MEKGKQRDGGRGCPPGPEVNQVLIELGELTFPFKCKILIELAF